MMRAPLLAVWLATAFVLASCDDVVVTFVVRFTNAPGSDGGDVRLQKAQFGSDFKLAFAEAVENVGCVDKAPIVNQKITFTPVDGVPTTASIVFTYPVDPIITPNLAQGVAHVVAAPSVWFGNINSTRLFNQRLTYFIGPFDTAFLSSTSVPLLTPIGPGGGCSPPPPIALPPSPPTTAPFPPPRCDFSSYNLTLVCQSSITLGRATLRQLSNDYSNAFSTALFVAGGLGTTDSDYSDATASFDDATLAWSNTFTLALCEENLPALQLVEQDGTYYILQSTQVGVDFAALGSFETCVVTPTSTISPPPPSPPGISPPSPSPNPPLPGNFPSPPPPFACSPNSAILSNIKLNGDYATVIAALTLFQRELAAALASLWCTCFSAVIVGTPQPLVESQYTFQVPVRINFNTGVTFFTNPSTCTVASYSGLIDAFTASSTSPVSCFARIESQDSYFAPQWSITAGTCNEGEVLSPPPPPPPPFTTPFSPPPSPPPVYSPPVYSPPPLYSSPPRPPPSPPSLRRQLIDKEESASSIKINALEPADVAYGSDLTLYELFTAPSNFFEAGAICLSRHAMLASYSDMSQVFVDVLCDSSAGMTCWVDGAKGGSCASVDNGVMAFVPCDRRQHFVCMTKGAAA